jgi:hypothetical protein
MQAPGAPVDRSDFRRQVRDSAAGGEGGDVQEGSSRREGAGEHGGRKARIVEGWWRDEKRFNPGRTQGAGVLQHPEVGVSRPGQDDPDACADHPLCG